MTVYFPHFGHRVLYRNIIVFIHIIKIQTLKKINKTEKQENIEYIQICDIYT